jgi:hypothetical protein
MHDERETKVEEMRSGIRELCGLTIEVQRGTAAVRQGRK